MTQCLAIYSGIATSAEALLEHEAEYGPAPPGKIYKYRIWPDPGHFPGYFFEVYCGDDPMSGVYRMVVNYEWNSPATNSAVTTHDWEWIDSDPISSSSYESVEAKFDTFLGVVGNYWSEYVHVVGYRWAEWKSDYSGLEPSFRFAQRDIPGDTGTTLLPPQVSCAITEENAIRRRWGRFYLPFIGASAVTQGRFTNTFCDDMANAAAVLLSEIEGEWRHVTVSSKEPRLLPTEWTRVDNTPDVIRSRRWSGSSYRKRTALT